ncbi:MAG: hypothetical protein HYZ75_11835 [Elusimicrobia bacterium]|nr:hypothetical protein [Elusimicrobiota bacterium]
MTQATAEKAPSPAADTPPRTRAEAFWRRLLLDGQKGPEVIKWVAFGRRLMLTVCALILFVGVGLTGLSAFQMSGLVERSLRARGQTIAEAVARAAFVPLTLEDKQTLREIARQHLTQEDIVSLSILDPAGVEWAGFSRPGTGESKVWRVQAAIRPTRGGAAGGPLGSVEVAMSGEQDFKRLLRLVLTSLAVNGLFTTALLLVGVALIRKLTINLQALVDEARWSAELRRSNLQLEEFAYVASHDLQSPLRKVAGFAELLRERCADKLDPESLEFTQIIIDGTRRMQRLIEDLLTYSHVGSEPVKPVSIDLAGLLREVLSDLEATLARAGAAVTSENLPQVRADRRQMGQLFQNLIENAVKFHGEAPPRVHVSARREGTAWQFAVKDNGIGMDPKHAEQIFKMFRRLHPAHAYEGTGIGLAVARKIVERHGGRIWVESSPGRGATFKFTLPATEGKNDH